MSETLAVELATAPVEPEVPAEGDGIERLGRRRLILRRFLRSRAGVSGLIIFGVLVILAVFGPRFIADWRYTQVDTGHYLQRPSRRHWLGTTQAGRDVFAMMLRGLGKSTIIGLGVGFGATAIAAVVGSFAAYFGKWFDRIAMWVVDLLLVLPSFVITAIILRNISASSGIWFLMLFLMLFGWMLSARVVRSLTMSVRDRDYVVAAKYMGVSGPRIVFRHILPNISSLLIVDATLGVAGAVLAETSLSFFGFGVRPPETSLGAIIGDGARMATTFPWVFLSGAVPLVLLVLSINFIGDGLRDALDPTSAAGGRA